MCQIKEPLCERLSITIRYLQYVRRISCKRHDSETRHRSGRIFTTADALHQYLQVRDRVDLQDSNKSLAYRCEALSFFYRRLACCAMYRSSRSRSVIALAACKGVMPLVMTFPHQKWKCTCLPSKAEPSRLDFWPALWEKKSLPKHTASTGGGKKREPLLEYCPPGLEKGMKEVYLYDGLAVSDTSVWGRERQRKAHSQRKRRTRSAVPCMVSRILCVNEWLSAKPPSLPNYCSRTTVFATAFLLLLYGISTQ